VIRTVPPEEAAYWRSSLSRWQRALANQGPLGILDKAWRRRYEHLAAVAAAKLRGEDAPPAPKGLWS
jgi:hypothetical protein